MKLEDKLWLIFNKRSNKQNETYFSMALIWVTVGMLIGIAGILLISEMNILPKILISSLALITAILQSTVYFKDDKRKGYIDKIQEHYIQRRIEIAKRLNIELDSNYNVIKKSK